MKAVWVATIMSMLLIILSGSLPPKVPFTMIVGYVLMPAFFIYLVILAQITRSRKKSGLTLAFGTGSMVFYEIVVQYPSHLSLNVGRWPAVYFTLVAVTQIFLVTSAFKTYYTMQFERRDLRRLAVGIGVPLIIFSVMEPSFAGPYGTMAGNQISILMHIRKFTSCANAYSIERPDSGFPESLALIVRSAGECNDDWLVRDEIRGYRITYVPGARDANGAIKTYTISARPIDYFQTGRASFRSNESGEIRITYEDRAADGQDPVCALRDQSCFAPLRR